MYSNTNSTVNIITWNANGLSRKINELRDFVSEHSPELLFLQEHKLSPSSPISIPNYCVYRSNRAIGANRQRGGGTALLVKCCIPHYQVTIPQLSAIEATAISIITNANITYTFVSTNIPPRKLHATGESDLNSLLSLGTHVIIGG
ncbi:RNA-directed DNA polymerase from mobile element jockey, partial [Stegodyphus mimosarum]